MVLMPWPALSWEAQGIGDAQSGFLLLMLLESGMVGPLECKHGVDHQRNAGVPWTLVGVFLRLKHVCRTLGFNRDKTAGTMPELYHSTAQIEVPLLPPLGANWTCPISATGHWI